MSTNEELLVALDTEISPVSTDRLADKLGVTRDSIVPQLEQFNQKVYVTKNCGDRHLSEK